MSDLGPYRSMHRPVKVTHSLFIEGSHTTKNTASGLLTGEPKIAQAAAGSRFSRTEYEEVGGEMLGVT